MHPPSPSCRPLARFAHQSTSTLPLPNFAFRLPALFATPRSVLGVGTLARVSSPEEVLIASVQLDSVERASRARAPLCPQRQRERILIGVFLFTVGLLAYTSQADTQRLGLTAASTRRSPRC